MGNDEYLQRAFARTESMVSRGIGSEFILVPISFAQNSVRLDGRRPGAPSLRTTQSR